MLQHTVLGNLYLPKLTQVKILPGGVIRRASPGEIGIYVAYQKRYNKSKEIWETLWASVTHNERVDAGAAYQAKQVFGGSGSPGAPSATAYFNVIALANVTLTKAKGDQSLGAAGAGVTTNEFTTIGLARATATLIAGNYTTPTTLGGQFTQVVSRQFTASGTGTVHGAGLFNSTTVAASIMYSQDNFASTSILNSGDTLTVDISTLN